MIKVFIDGSEGTTGLRIADRLKYRDDITLLTPCAEKRKDVNERKRLLNESDITFLCLPDAAARESVSLLENKTSRIIDASTAHRTEEGWTYGFPELFKGHSDEIAKATLVANPGCHASGFISLVYPLISEKLIPNDFNFSCFSVTGYSGGGKKMIAEYEADKTLENRLLESPRQYGLTQNHKHLKEMTKICGLKFAPVFSPIVSDFYSGMAVSVPLYSGCFSKHITQKELYDFYVEYYSGYPLISVVSDNESFLNADTLSGKDTMEIHISGNDERYVITSRFDNLGKGASGSAIQCFNIMTGEKETKGLIL